MLQDLTHYWYLSLLSLYLSRRLLLILSLTLRGFDISVRALRMSFFHLRSKSPGCIRRTPGKGATAAKREFLLFQIGRDD